MTCTVQPAIQSRVRDKSGTQTLVDMPLLLDCPVQFPAGGGCTLTFPVKPGDECLVVFASRCIDAWWQSGGVQAPAEYRMHDRSDGFALLGFRSQPRVIGAVSTSAAQLRSDDGATFISVAPGGAVAITAPAGLTINADVVVNGKVTTTGDVKAGTISLQTHKHTGVQAGSSTSGGPTP
ncbi:translation initiation factor IF-2 [Pseudomonas sp. AU12215]|nr:translation initiation factor IF-2 [Pseudomonas sp. AU12215]